MDKPHTPENAVEVDRVQTGVRIEKRLLKVLKAVAELKDIRANMSGIQTIWVIFERKADSPNCWKQ
jgi:hypothetical protein